MSFPKLMVELARLIARTFEEGELKMFLFEHIRPKEYDYNADAQGTTYRDRVFHTVRWAEQFGGRAKVVWLAEVLARERPEHEDWRGLMAAFASPSRPPILPGAAGALPDDITNALGLFDAGAMPLHQLGRDLRLLVRGSGRDLHDLPERFHLADSDGYRMLAVVALERTPHIEYLRWLWERVIVERPALAYVAAQALIAAALRLERETLPRVRKAIEHAADRLDLLYEEDDGVATGFDLAARKRELQSAAATVELRTKQGRSPLSTDEMNQFLSALLSAFDHGSFGQLCQNQLGIPLKRLVNLDETIELIVVKVVLLAREKGWELDLVSGAYAERSSETVFAQLHGRYSGPTSPAQAPV